MNSGKFCYCLILLVRAKLQHLIEVRGRTYADKFSYTTNGAVNGLRLGNFRWESTEFNSRLQPIKIGVGSRKSTTDILQLDFNYGTGNNGNIQSQTITVPTEIRNNQTYNAFTAVQTYTYDSLNRIKDAAETISVQTWKQTYTYDRFGNRNFDEANTTTIPRNCNNNTEICPADRKVFNPSISVSNESRKKWVIRTFDTAGEFIATD